MINDVYIITQEQAELLQGRSHSGGNYSPFQNNTPEHNWCITQEEIDQTTDEDLLEWMSELTETEEFVPKTGAKP